MPLKVLKPELAGVVGAERFLAEIKTTPQPAAPAHPAAPRLGEAERFLLYVLPYVEGESLRERIDRGLARLPGRPSSYLQAAV